MSDMQVLMASSHRQVLRVDGASSRGRKVSSTKSDRKTVSPASGSRQMLLPRPASHSTIAAEDIGHLVTLIISATIQTILPCKTTQHTRVHKHNTNNNKKLSYRRETALQPV